MNALGEIASTRCPSKPRARCQRTTKVSALKVVTAFLALTALATFSTSGPATAQGNCGHPNGDHVVIEVKWEDPIGGLAVRDGPNGGANGLGTRQASGTGSGVW